MRHFCVVDIEKKDNYSGVQVRIVITRRHRDPNNYDITYDSRMMRFPRPNPANSPSPSKPVGAQYRHDDFGVNERRRVDFIN